MTDEKAKADELSITEGTAPPPVFNCLVYVGNSSEGGVRVRVANLPDLQLVAANEREALSRVVPEFKKRVAEYVQRGESIPWIDPPLDPDEDEQQRFIAVHL